jgi:glycosyltransferase involved in cell wall biosynthesis
MIDNTIITYKDFPCDKNCRFSIIIPTWNNLSLLKLCVNSIFKNSRFQHQIILHINEGSDGSRIWAEDNKISYSFSEKNEGVCVALNSAATLAATDYVVYFNDDMYACPDWDFYLWEEIQQQPDNDFFLSATSIEPRDVHKKVSIAPYNFGTCPDNFKETELLQQFVTLPKNDWSGASWPPNVVHRNMWEKVGGYSLEFSPGFYSDPDFSMKLWKAGVRRFKGVEKSRVYHFLEASTNKISNHVIKTGRKLFLKKWGITARVFYKYYLQMGKAQTTQLLAQPKNMLYYLDYIICILKKTL